MHVFSLLGRMTYVKDPEFNAYLAKAKDKKVGLKVRAFAEVLDDIGLRDVNFHSLGWIPTGISLF